MGEQAQEVPAKESAAPKVADGATQESSAQTFVWEAQQPCGGCTATITKLVKRVLDKSKTTDAKFEVSLEKQNVTVGPVTAEVAKLITEKLTKWGTNAGKKISAEPKVVQA